MNHQVSDIDSLAADDIDGGRALYPGGGGPTPPPPPPPPSSGSPSVFPASPHPYADRVDTSWTHTLGGNPAAVDVTFDPRTAVEDDYDYIYVMDANGNNVPGSPFTGTSLAGQTTRVPGATVRIRLTTDGSVTAWGFAVTNVTAASSSPSAYPASPHPYSDYVDRTWSYTLAGNPSAINVTFDGRTAVESAYDYIYVMDGRGNQIPGSPFTGTTLAGQTRRVPGATVQIRLTSDGSITDWGFAVTGVSATSLASFTSQQWSQRQDTQDPGPKLKKSVAAADQSAPGSKPPTAR
jgi:hypothetical protein